MLYRFAALIVAALNLSLVPGHVFADDLAAKPRRPNVVLILADDLGWSDLGCYGADLHETPNLDRLAQGAVRFTNAYAMSVCSPTRAMLLTGKHAARLQITIWAEGSLDGPKNRPLLQGASRHDLPHAETTLAARLQSAGYLTALVGKWHLGDAQHYPETHGFDVNIGGTLWGAPQTFFWPYRGVGRFGNEYRYVPHLEFGRPGEYLTDRLTDEAISVINSAGDRPFFLYLAHHAPHTPIEAKPADTSHFEATRRADMHHQNIGYAAMVKSLDESVGRILEHLKLRGIDQNTIVVFTSDNGGYVGVDKASGYPEAVTTNVPLRSGKGSLYEGGIRVPLIVRGPGWATNALCAEPVSLADLYPTILELLDLPAAEGPIDGVDLSGLLNDPSTALDRDALYFHYPHYYHTTTPVGAVRVRDWKLLEYFEDNRVELYNLASDLSEARDLSPQMPEKSAELREKLHAWRDSVGAAMPTLNPNFRAKKK
jgi:arylsulfatase A-like enzyme